MSEQPQTPPIPGPAAPKKRSSPMVDRMFRRWVPDKTEEDLDWVSDAEWARLQQEPVRARVVLVTIGLVLAALLLWAAFAEVDEVTRGTGKVIPSRQLQIIHPACDERFGFKGIC